MKMEPNPELPQDAANGEPLTETTRRTFLRAAGLLTAGMMLPRLHGQLSAGEPAAGERLLVVIVGGVRRAETFSPEGFANIPHLAGDLLPNSIFYAHARNEGVTAHFNAISSILTGNWQRVDDWGKIPPRLPYGLRTVPQGTPRTAQRYLGRGQQ